MRHERMGGMRAETSIRYGRLEVDDLRHRYGDIEIVSGVSFKVRPGEVVCLLGPSGSGKTTVLRLLAGLERPCAGHIVLDDAVLAGPDRFVPPERPNVGLMFQDYALFPHLTLLQNVTFGLAGRPLEAAHAHAIALLERVGLAARAGDYPHMLSGGEQQRLTLARTLAPGPQLILMDEPFSNLDQRLRQRMREMTLALLAERGISAIIVTHAPDEAMLIADRVVLIERGRVLQTGTPEDLYRRPSSLFAARFFADLNEVPADCSNGVATCALGTFPAPGLPDGPALVCFRPNGLAVVPGTGQREATVTDVRFIGGRYRVMLALDGAPEPLQAYAGARAGLAEPGARVSLDIAPEHVLVFGAGERHQAPVGDRPELE